MPSFKITLAYDGTGFVGWQRQAAGTSIQGLLEDALRDLDGRDVAVTGAGRTDAGVHALGQAAGFSLDRAMTADVLLRALNARLPPSVRIVAAAEVAASFHARFDARAKTYRYRIWQGDVLNPFERFHAWHVTGALDVACMAAAAARLVGRHDFAAFQAAGSDVESTEREISVSRIGTTEDTEGNGGHGNSKVAVPTAGLRDFRGDAFGGTLLFYEVTGSGFLRHMVRTIAGTLVEIGRGRRPVDWIDDVLASRDRAQAGPTAPAEGLVLVRVDYA